MKVKPFSYGHRASGGSRIPCKLQTTLTSTFPIQTTHHQWWWSSSWYSIHNVSTFLHSSLRCSLETLNPFFANSHQLPNFPNHIIFTLHTKPHRQPMHPCGTYPGLVEIYPAAGIHKYPIHLHLLASFSKRILFANFNHWISFSQNKPPPVILSCYLANWHARRLGIFFDFKETRRMYIAELNFR